MNQPAVPTRPDLHLDPLAGGLGVLGGLLLPGANSGVGLLAPQVSAAKSVNDQKMKDAMVKYQADLDAEAQKYKEGTAAFNEKKSSILGTQHNEYLNALANSQRGMHEAAEIGKNAELGDALTGTDALATKQAKADAAAKVKQEIAVDFAQHKAQEELDLKRGTLEAKIAEIAAKGGGDAEINNALKAYGQLGVQLDEHALQRAKEAGQQKHWADTLAQAQRFHQDNLVVAKGHLKVAEGSLENQRQNSAVQRAATAIKLQESGVTMDPKTGDFVISNPTLYATASPAVQKGLTLRGEIMKGVDTQASKIRGEAAHEFEQVVGRDRNGNLNQHLPTLKDFVDRGLIQLDPKIQYAGDALLKPMTLQDYLITKAANDPTMRQAQQSLYDIDNILAHQTRGKLGKKGGPVQQNALPSDAQALSPKMQKKQQ